MRTLFIDGIRQLMSWVRAHPFKAIGFTWFLTLLAAIYAVTSALLFVGLYVVSSMLLLAIIVRDISKVIPVALVLATLVFGSNNGSVAQSKVEGIKAVPVGVGIVVIVAGGVATYYLVRFCQKHFAPPPPDPSTNNAAAGGDYGGVYSYSAWGSCYTPDTKSLEPYANGIVAIEGDRVLRISSVEPVDRATFFEGLNKAGLYVPEVGHWMTTSDCLSFEPGSVPTVRLCGGGAQHVVVLERSSDGGRSWAPLVTNALPDGISLRFYDATGEMAMYRLSAQ